MRKHVGQGTLAEAAKAVHAQGSGKHFRLRQGQALRILGRQARLTRKLPVNRQRGIVPGNAALMLGSVVIGGFVQKLGGVAEHHKAVRKARWHPELAVVVGAQFSAHPLAEGG